MNQDLIALLEEASTVLSEMYNVSDNCVADLKLNIVITNMFVLKALDSEDRLDIFNALQKVYDILETDNSNDVEGKDDLAERIKAVLTGMNEGIMKKSTLKSLVKTVLKEIKLKKVEQEPSFMKLFSADISRPEFRNPKDGYKFAYVALGLIKGDIKASIIAMRNNDQKKLDSFKEQYVYHRDYLMQFVHYWVGEFYEHADENVTQKLLGRVTELMDHMEQLSHQIDTICESIVDYKNHINALKEIKHLAEILNEITFCIDSIFSMNNLNKHKVWPTKKK